MSVVLMIDGSVKHVIVSQALNLGVHMLLKVTAELVSSDIFVSFCVCRL